MTDAEIRELARREWANDDVEIDVDAVVSRSGEGTEGAFVAAWVWVSFPINEAEGL